MPGQGGPVGHIGGVWQAQRLLYGQRAFAGAGRGRHLGAERGCTSTSATANPATAVAGLDGPITAPAHDESAWFAGGPASRSRSGSGRLGRARAGSSQVHVHQGGREPRARHGEAAGGVV